MKVNLKLKEPFRLQFFLLIALVFNICLPWVGSGQERAVYTTEKGNMRLLLQRKGADTAISAETKALLVQFNYDVPKIRFSVPLPKFKCNDSAFRKAIKEIPDPSIRFQGSMKLRSLKDQRFPKVIFPIEGFLAINNQRKYVKLTGNLFPVEYLNKYQAQLTVKSRLKLSQFGLQQYLPGFRDRFYIVIRQSVLRPKP